MTKTIHVDETTDLEVPDNYGPEETDRHIREFQAWQQQQKDQPKSDPNQIPQPNQPYDYHNVDPSRVDSWPTWAGKAAGSFVRGGGQSIATMGDILSNVPKAFRNDLRYLAGSSSPTNPYEDYTAPVSQAYESVVPAQPTGSTYEDAATTGEVVVPAAIEALATEGASALKGNIKPWRIADKAAMRTGRDVTLGLAGGEAGGAVASTIAGEGARDLGRLFGGAIVPATTATLANKGLAHMLLTPQSAGKIKTIDTFNEGLPPEKQITPTAGLVGKGATSAVEDVTSRSFLAPRAAETRLKNYQNLEGGVQEQIATARGEPATGPITPETIGSKAQVMIKARDDASLTRLRQIQTDLENTVGSAAPTNLTNLNKELDDIISKPLEHGPDLIRDAKEIKAMAAEALVAPKAQARGRVSRPRQAGYGAIKDIRNRLGKMLNTKGTRYIEQGRAAGYSGLTKDMEESAAMQGVPPEEFAKVQTETSDLLKRRTALEDLKGRTEGETYRATAGKGGDVQNLAPLPEQDQIKLIADDLELRIRKGEAGKDVNASKFDVNTMKYWDSLSPDRKLLLAKNNPDIVKKMDAASEIATMERNRAGQRSRPGKGGSTLGTSIGTGLNIGSGLAGAGGAGYLSFLLGSPILGAGLGAAGIMGPRYIGNKLTDPNFVRKLAQVREEGIGGLLGKAVIDPRRKIGPAAAASNIHETEQERMQREQSNVEERKRRGFKD